MIFLKKKPHPALLIASEAAAPRCRVRMTEGEAHPAAVWLLAFRRVPPPGRRSAVGLPLGLRARGCAQGQDQQHSITRQRHPFAITIREAPLGWCEGWVGEFGEGRGGWGGRDIYERSAHTHAHVAAIPLIYCRPDCGMEPESSSPPHFEPLGGPL